MRSSRSSLGRRLRPWLGPLAAVLVSLGLVLLPPRTKAGLAQALERTVFLPFRFALGWGPRSLLAQHRSAEEFRAWTTRALRLDTAEEAMRENDNLRALLGFRRRTQHELILAVVVGRGRDRFGDLLTVRPEAPLPGATGWVAVTPDGLLGRVTPHGAGDLRVECLTNANVGVSVLNQRSREGGILRWDPARERLLIEGMAAQADWQEGDRVVTSGLGTAFPRGILVGWVLGRASDRGGALQQVTVRPAASASRAQMLFLMRPEPAADNPAELRGGAGLYPAETPWIGRAAPGAGAGGMSPAPAP